MLLHTPVYIAIFIKYSCLLLFEEARQPMWLRQSDTGGELLKEFREGDNVNQWMLTEPF